MDNKKNVLIVEDNKYIKDMYSAWLKNYWIDFTIANTLEEAERIISNSIHSFGIISFDWRLPDGMTWELVKNTRKRFTWIMISATSDPSIRQQHYEWWCDFIVPEKRELPKKILSIIWSI